MNPNLSRWQRAQKKDQIFLIILKRLDLRTKIDDRIDTHVAGEGVNHRADAVSLPVQDFPVVPHLERVAGHVVRRVRRDGLRCAGKHEKVRFILVALEFELGRVSGHVVRRKCGGVVSGVLKVGVRHGREIIVAVVLDGLTATFGGRIWRKGEIVDLM